MTASIIGDVLEDPDKLQWRIKNLEAVLSSTGEPEVFLVQPIIGLWPSGRHPLFESYLTEPAL